jgi:hypothetical protein
MGRIYESAMHLRGPAAVAEAPVAAAWDTAASALLPCPTDRIAGSENSTMMTCSHPVERSQRHPSSWPEGDRPGSVLDRRQLGIAEGATAGPLAVDGNLVNKPLLRESRSMPAASQSNFRGGSERFGSPKNKGGYSFLCSTTSG